MKRTVLLARWVLAPIYLFAGVAHLHSPGFFMRIVPAWVPYPLQTVQITGICEVLGAIGLIIPRTRRLAGVMLALYAVCVFPANIKHAIDDLSAGTGLGWGYHGPRLLAQPFIVWWALFAGEVTTWPFQRKPRSADRDR